MKPTTQECLQALSKVVTFARIVRDDLELNAGGDAYEYKGNMNDVEALRDALKGYEELFYRVAK